MKRKIVKIDESKCNGCGICVKACHEGAIEIIDGKARLVSDVYCDGLGDCLGGCPMDAIEIIERESLAYDDVAVEERKKSKEDKGHNLPCGCPGTLAKKIERVTTSFSVKSEAKKKPLIKEFNEDTTSELRQWPVQLKLINPNAEYLKGAHLLVAADCTAYAYGNFHQDFIKDKITVIGCPKLDDKEFYKEKLIMLLQNNNLKSLTVVRMEVPCCAGIVEIVKRAMLEAKIIIPYNEVVIGTDGSII